MTRVDSHNHTEKRPSEYIYQTQVENLGMTFE